MKYNKLLNNLIFLEIDVIINFETYYIGDTTVLYIFNVN